jgi:hypothetical protein
MSRTLASPISSRSGRADTDYADRGHTDAGPFLSRSCRFDYQYRYGKCICVPWIDPVNSPHWALTGSNKGTVTPVALHFAVRDGSGLIPRLNALIPRFVFISVSSAIRGQHWLRCRYASVP